MLYAYTIYNVKRYEDKNDLLHLCTMYVLILVIIII